MIYVWVAKENYQNIDLYQKTLRIKKSTEFGEVAHDSVIA